MAFASKCAFVVVALFALALTNHGVVDAGRSQSKSHRKPSSSGSGNSGQVTQPSYNTHTNNNGGSNSHADVAKLSYPNYNSQPNRPATGNAPAPGWNVPQGPPPAYSAQNPAGGGRTNVHEPPPSYNNNYGGVSGSNVHQPITATQNHGQQYAGVPPGATYYPAGSHVPGGGYQPSNLPAGATYYPSAGHMPNGGYHPGVAAPPPGATYYQAGSALPPGATYYAQPPQQSSSGLGFGKPFHHYINPIEYITVVSFCRHRFVGWWTWRRFAWSRIDTQWQQRLIPTGGCSSGCWTGSHHYHK